MTDHAAYLDDPAWSALTGPHAALALVDGDARRYPADVSPFAAVGRAMPTPWTAWRG